VIKGSLLLNRLNLTGDAEFGKRSIAFNKKLNYEMDYFAFLLSGHPLDVLVLFFKVLEI
jgi:hypothetical protein